MTTLPLVLACVSAPAGARVEPASWAAGSASSVERVARVEGVTEYRLANGLRVLLFPDPSQSTVTVNVTYLVGSRHEAYGETGMAHLLEHLLFKGTDRHDDISGEIARRGGQAGGNTHWDRTTYAQTLPPTAENLEWAIGMEADRMVNSRLAAEDLAREMPVVRNEFEMTENNHHLTLRWRTLAAAYRAHGYGRTPIGVRSDIEGVPIERLRAFYRKYYQPDNAVVVVTGAFDETAALELVRSGFGAIPRPDRSGVEMALRDTYTREPAQEGERRVELRRVGDVQMVAASFHVPAGSHPDHAAMEVLGHILGNAPSGRLYQALVETGKAATVGVFAPAMAEPGFFMVHAEVHPDQSLDEAERALLAAIDALTTRPPTHAEVERARAALRRDLRLAFTSPNHIGMLLSVWSGMGDWRLFFLHRDRVEAVTPEDVASLVATYLQPVNRTVGRLIPTPRPVRVAVPDVPDVGTLVADYRGGEVVPTGHALDPAPAALEARTIRLELEDGTGVALLPKDTRGGGVRARVVLRLGAEETLRGRATDGNMAAGMLMRGTRRLDRQALEDELVMLDARIAISGSATQVVADLETTGPNLAAALRLLGHVLREPAFDDAEFELLRRERVAGLERQTDDPGAVGTRALNRHLDPRPAEHARYTPTLEEEARRVTAATLEGARSFHRAFHGTGAGATVAIVGAFEPAEAEAALVAALGGWTRATPFAPIPASHPEVEPAVLTITTPDRDGAYLFAGMNIDARDEDPDYPALHFANHLFGGFWSSRLFNRIRQQEGLSYGVNSSVAVGARDRGGRFTVSIMCSPGDVDRVRVVFMEELERALRDGFTDQEVADARAGWLHARQVVRTTDPGLLHLLSTGLYLGRTLEREGWLEGEVAALTGDDVTAAFRRHLDPRGLTLVRVGDFDRVPGT